MKSNSKSVSIRFLFLVLFVSNLVIVGAIGFVSSIAPAFWWLFAIAGLAANSLVSYLFYNKLISPILRIRKNKNVHSSQVIDLTSRFNISGGRELSSFIYDVNRLVGRLHHTVYDILNVQRLSQEVASNLIEETTRTLDSIGRSERKLTHVAHSELELEQELVQAEQKLNTIREKIKLISNQVKSQDSSLAQSSAAVEEMVASIQSISSSVQNQSVMNNQVGTLATQSNAAIEHFGDSLANIQKNVAFVQQSINEIQDISEQSALLAMNASIEAAHAGEHGKGFSVVALEMRKLSERAKQNAQVVVGNLSQVARNITEVSNLMTSSKKSFSDLFSVLDTYRQNVEDIGSNLLEMNTGTSEILNSLARLQAISGEVYAASDEINVEVQPFTDTMLKIKTSSSLNHRLVNETKEEVSKVKISSETLSITGTHNSQVLEALKRELDHIKITDLSTLKAIDGQRLISWDPVRKIIPKRPDNPNQYPEHQSQHWWDIEFAGWNISKQLQPVSKADGPEGKRVSYMFASRINGSGYVEALFRGADKVANQNKILLSPYYADFDQPRQIQQIEEAIAKKTDLIILQAIDIDKIHPIIEKLYKMGIPVINSLQTVGNQTFPYILNFTGPDDWGQTRMLARSFADAQGKKGGFCILQHVPGSSTDYGRTYGTITELSDYAPDLKFLEKQYPEFAVDKACDIVKSWVAKYGSSLTGIYCGDDNDVGLGVKKALLETNRTDIVVCAAGNSKVGMDLVKEGIMQYITYQSAESGGALPLVSAIDWFNGVELPPITYLPIKLISKENVDSFYPPQF